MNSDPSIDTSEDILLARGEVLLPKAAAIVEQYEAIANLQGLRFNLFDILDRTTDEEKGHSAMLAELLKPDGTHGLGDSFLRLFLDMLSSLPEQMLPSYQISRFSSGATGDWNVSTEVAFDSVDGNKELSGRVDLVMESSDALIVIENKIHALDQDKQLFRYWKWATERKPDAALVLIYLTLDGHDPTEKSLHQLSKDKVLNLGYDTFIEPWLDRCVEKASTVHQVRENIVQYRQIVRRLTGKGWSKTMNEKIADMLLSGDNLKLAFAIASAIPHAEAHAQLRFWDALEGKLADKLTIDREQIKRTKRFDNEEVLAYHQRTRGAKDYGIWTELCKAQDGNLVGFCVAVDDYIYLAFMKFSPDGQWLKLTPEEQKGAVTAAACSAGSGFKSSAWYFGWKYTEKNFNFRARDEEIVKLATDDKYLEGIVESIADEAVKAVKAFREAYAQN